MAKIAVRKQTRARSGRIAPPHRFRRRNTQFELSYNKPDVQELLVP